MLEKIRLKADSANRNRPFDVTVRRPSSLVSEASFKITGAFGQDRYQIVSAIVMIRVWQRHELKRFINRHHGHNQVQGIFQVHIGINQAVGLAVIVPSTPNKMQPLKNLFSLEGKLVRDEHGHFFLISPVIIPEIVHQIPLLKQGRNHNPDRPENV